MPRKKTLPLSHKAEDLYLGRDSLIQLGEALLEPCVISSIIWVLGFVYEGAITAPYFILSVLVFALLFPGKARMHESWWQSNTDILLSCFMMQAIMLALGFATGTLDNFPEEAILHWLWLAPLSLVVANLAFRRFLPRLVQIQGGSRRAVILGLNDQGVELARRMAQNPYDEMELLGFFDDRGEERTAASDMHILGKLDNVAAYCKENHVQLVYICLPMASQPRILNVLDDIRDTTASVYFVPDFFVTDIIQGRMAHVCNMPVVSVCETPFTGVNGMIKRISDIVLSLMILTMISPLLAVIAAAVKFTSPGPIIFKQRRYGLDGEEILVYKFRSMTVCEDGNVVKQAQKNDSRLTPIGGFLRKTSLDELPQFLNVLQGRMSIVGPRPHAIAHNELYRKLIKGYMIRHKAKPGITGWAQVNGLRGETETVDKMADRIEYDLDYLRNWSLGLDVKIIMMTVGVVFKDQYAY